MIPHPETDIVVRDTEHRLHLNRLGREGAFLIDVAPPAGRNGRTALRRAQPLLRIAFRVLGRLPLAGLSRCSARSADDGRARTVRAAERRESGRWARLGLIRRGASVEPIRVPRPAPGGAAEPGLRQRL